MNTKLIVTSLIAAGLLGISGASFAQDAGGHLGGHPGGPGRHRLGPDGPMGHGRPHARLSQRFIERHPEAKARVMRKFDANSDGVLSDEERTTAREAIKARVAEKKQQVIENFDVNGDGQLNEQERAEAREMRHALRAERRAAFIEKYDADGDGQLSDAERAAVKEALKARIAEKKSAS